MARPKRITDGDECQGDEGLARLHASKHARGHHPTPSPIPHGEPGPRTSSPRKAPGFSLKEGQPGHARRTLHADVSDGA